MKAMHTRKIIWGGGGWETKHSFLSLNREALHGAGRLLSKPLPWKIYPVLVQTKKSPIVLEH